MDLPHPHWERLNIRKPKFLITSVFYTSQQWNWYFIFVEYYISWMFVKFMSQVHIKKVFDEYYFCCDLLIRQSKINYIHISLHILSVTTCSISNYLYNCQSKFSKLVASRIFIMMKIVRSLRSDKFSKHKQLWVLLSLV